MIFQQTLLKQPVCLKNIETPQINGVFKARLVQIDYLEDSMEVIRYYFKILNKKLPKDTFSVWSALSSSHPKMAAKFIADSINHHGSIDASSRAVKNRIHGVLFDAANPLGKTCLIEVSGKGPLSSGLSDIKVLIPKHNGDYYRV